MAVTELAPARSGFRAAPSERLPLATGRVAETAMSIQPVYQDSGRHDANSAMARPSHARNHQGSVVLMASGKGVIMIDITAGIVKVTPASAVGTGGNEHDGIFRLAICKRNLQAACESADRGKQSWVSDWPSR